MSPPSADQRFTLPLDSPESNLNTTGGKGHNLAILSRDGNFPVPPGFVVTVSAYHHFVSCSPGLLSEVEAALSKLQVNDESPATGTAKFEEISDAIREAFRKRDIPKDLRNEIAERLSTSSIFPDIDNTYLAVRSSATCEDMPDASFAGQHDTMLNVKPTVDNVCQHVIDCFSSLFTSRAISYRENNGIDHIGAGMAVVVQAMVQSESSGVLFTANPLTGRRSESILEAIPGLGEALVSGLVEPDRYIVSRNSDKTIAILDKRIGAKAKAIRSVEGGGVREETIVSEATPLLSGNGESNGGSAPGVSECKTVLSDEEVTGIIRLGQEVEALFNGKAQDIEWARSSEGKTYIVQSRPITTLFPLPNVPAEPLQVFFSFNAVQGIAGAMTPSGQDALRTILGGLIRYISWGRHGTKGHFLETVAERLYGNLTNVLSNSIGRKIILGFLAHIEPGILAGINEVLPSIKISGGLSPFLLIRMLSIYSVIIPRAIYCLLFPDRARERLIERTDAIVKRVEREATKINGLSELVGFKRQTFQSFFPSVVTHFAPRMAVAMGPLAVLTKMASKVEGGKDIVLIITRGLPHNGTTEMDLELWQVAKTIQNDDASLEHFRSTSADTLANNYLQGNLPETSQKAIQRFMSDYGMRGLCEIDFGRPRWREEPSPLMQTLKSYIEIDEAHAPDKVFAAGEVAAEDAIQRLGKELGKPKLVSFLARRTRSIAGIRELPKFTIIRLMGIVRAKMIEEGEKLVKSDTLQNPKDIFLLHDDEIIAIGQGDEGNWKDVIAERRAVMASEATRPRVPRVLTSDGFGFYGGAATKANIAEGENILCGEPVSPGTYEGHVRIVHSPTESQLRPGEILVCHGTDPSWTPLFLSAGALLMEVGGLMTHGSVVAREYGIAAIVGIEKVTERLTTGQLVRIDGSSGVVEILEDENVEDTTERKA